jgi:hypothetical protein
MHKPIEYFVCYQTHDSLQIGPTSTKVTPELGSLRRCGENVKVPLTLWVSLQITEKGYV